MLADIDNGLKRVKSCIRIQSPLENMMSVLQGQNAIMAGNDIETHAVIDIEEHVKAGHTDADNANEEDVDNFADLATIFSDLDAIDMEDSNYPDLELDPETGVPSPQQPVEPDALNEVLDILRDTPSINSLIDTLNATPVAPVLDRIQSLPILLTEGNSTTKPGQEPMDLQAVFRVGESLIASNVDELSPAERYAVQRAQFNASLAKMAAEADDAYKRFGYTLEQFKQGGLYARSGLYRSLFCLSVSYNRRLIQRLLLSGVLVGGRSILGCF